MAKAANDVLAEWQLRGYITAEQAAAPGAYLSYINQAHDAITAYCNLPTAMVGLPDGLFYPWVEIAFSVMNGGVFQQKDGTVTRVKEGDTEIMYSGGTNGATAPMIDYSQTLDSFRNLF